MGIDVLPTLCTMAGAPLPAGVELDGKDISGVLTKGAPSPHDELILFDNEDVVAVRTQAWKYVAATYYHGYLLPISARKRGLTDSPQLYDMANDGSEDYSVASRQPEIVADMAARLARAQATFGALHTRPSNVKGAPSQPAQTERQD